jgi:hypothetical protein
VRSKDWLVNLGDDVDASGIALVTCRGPLRCHRRSLHVREWESDFQLAINGGYEGAIGHRRPSFHLVTDDAAPAFA